MDTVKPLNSGALNKGQRTTIQACGHPSIVARKAWQKGWPLLRSSTVLQKLLKDEYHANENPLKNSENKTYVGQRLMYRIKKKPYHAILFFKCH